jgi:hypothetical protein
MWSCFFGMPFWRTLGFEGIPQSIILIQNQHKLSNNGEQERCRKNKKVTQK